VVIGHCGRVTVLLVTQWSLWSLLGGQWSLWTSDRITGHSVVIVVIVVSVVIAQWSVVSGRVTVLLVTQWSLWSLLSGQWSLWTSDRITGHSSIVHTHSTTRVHCATRFHLEVAGFTAV